MYFAGSSGGMIGGGVKGVVEKGVVCGGEELFCRNSPVCKVGREVSVASGFKMIRDMK